MGSPELPRACLLVAAAFSRDLQAIDWGRQRAESVWGSVELVSEPIEVDRFTTYYRETMGEGLTKVLWAFAQLQPPERLVDWKLLTNSWEEEFAKQGQSEAPRPLNLDPGYLTEAKLVLATTKDRDHRIYLRDGIFAEVTLAYRKGDWRSNPWTYPDYQSAEYHTFLTRCRQLLREKYRHPN